MLLLLLLLLVPRGKGLAALMARSTSSGAEGGHRVDLLLWFLKLVDGPGPSIGEEVLLQDLVGLHGQPLVIGCL